MAKQLRDISTETWPWSGNGAQGPTVGALWCVQLKHLQWDQTHVPDNTANSDATTCSWPLGGG